MRLFGPSPIQGVQWTNIPSHMYPTQDDTFDIGKADKNWRHLFLSGNITLDTASWVGLDAAKARIVFTDTTIDTINFLSCNVGINTSTPAGLLHVVLAAGRPAIFGGDVLATVTGVTGTAANPTVLSPSTTNGVAIGDAVIINSGTNATVGTYWVVSVVVDTTVTLDRNASSGGAISAASVTYINDPIIIESGSGNGEPRIVLPSQNDAVTPTFAFGGGMAGFYSPANNQIGIALVGLRRFILIGNEFKSDNANGFDLLNEAASATNPTIAPNQTDIDTGIGHVAADALSLIAGGVEGIRVTEATTITSRLSDKTSFSNTAEGNTGSLNIQTARNVHTLASAAQSSTTFSPTIPNGSTLLGASFTVNTAVTTSGASNTWDADFITGSTTALVAAGASGSVDTKADKMIVPEVSNDIVNIEFDAPGVETFTGGIIEIIVYYIDLTSLADV